MEVGYATQTGTADADDLDNPDYTDVGGTLTFAPGDDEKIVYVQTHVDGTDDSGEFFSLKISIPHTDTSGAQIENESAQAWIVDQMDNSTLSIANASALEGEDLVFIVTREGQSDENVTVEYTTARLATADRSASGGSVGCSSCDYYEESGSLTFRPGENQMTITVETRTDSDATEAPGEHFRVDLSDPENAGFAKASAVGFIEEDCVDVFDADSEPPTITGIDARVDEDIGQFTIVFEVNPAVCTDPLPVVVFDTGLSGDSADSGDDYAGSSGTVFVRGRHIFIRSFSVYDDDLDEGDETVTGVIEEWASGNSRFQTIHTDTALYPDGRLATAVITIVDNDDPPELEVLDASAIEGERIRFPVRLSEPSRRAVTVEYYTHSVGAASPPGDYVEISSSNPQVLTFAPGETEKFAEVQTNTDSAVENKEPFQLVLQNPSNADIRGPRAIGTIIDGVLPGLSINSNYEKTGRKALEESSEQFEVTLNRASTETITVYYSTKQLSGDDAATEGVDFEEVSDAELTFNPGETLKTFVVAIHQDGDAEGDERFQVELSNPNSHAILADPIAGTVVEGQCVDTSVPDHIPPTVTIEDAQTIEDHRSGYKIFTFRLDRPFCSRLVNMEVDVRFDDPIGAYSASSADIDQTSKILTFAVNQTFSSYIGIRLRNDNIAENDETFQIAATWDQIYISGYQDLPIQYDSVDEVTATGTIIDDDNIVEVSIEDASGPEGSLLSFPVRLSREADNQLEVPYSVKRASSVIPPSSRATPDLDFRMEDNTLLIPPGEVGGVIEVPAFEDDDHNEGDEYFLVELTAPSGNDDYVLDSSVGVGTIVNVSPEAVLRVSDAVGDEGQVLVFEVTLDRAMDELVVVGFTTADGTAVAGSDYLWSSGVLRFAPGEVAKSVSVSALTDDALHEGEEVFFLNLLPSPDLLLADPQGEGRIRNLGVPDISVLDSGAVEGQSVVFEVVLSNRANRDITVGYEAVARTTSGAVAAAPDEDFVPVSGYVTITAGSLSAPVAVATVDDRLDEYPEAFALVLNSPSYGALADGSATGTIADNDDEPELIVNDTYVLENAGTMPVVFILSQPSGRNVSADYTFDNRSAINGTHYTGVDGTVTIPAGETEAVLEVPIIDNDDTHPPGNEYLRFLIQWGNGLNAKGIDGIARLSILDDEQELPVILVPSNDENYYDPLFHEAVEGNDVRIVVVLSHGDSADNVTVDYSVNNCGGSDPTTWDDFNPVMGRIEFISGDTEEIVSVPTHDDDEVESTERICLRLHQGSEVNALIGNVSGRGSILDNDGVPGVVVDDAVVAEGGVAEFMVRLTGPSADPVTVVYRAEADAFAGATAAVAGQDFAEVSGTETIAAGDVTAVVEVPVPEDALNEATETFWLRLDSADGADVRDAVATGSIFDDDPVPEVSISDAAAIEGEPVRLAVRLSEPSGRVVQVGYAPQTQSTADPENKATPVRDFDASPRALVIPAGVTEVFAEVDTVVDRIAEFEESFLVNLLNPDHAVIGVGTAVGTIIDSNDLPRASLTDTEAVEGGAPAQLTVALSHSSANPVTFYYNTFDGSAEAGDDYVAVVEGEITVPALATSYTFAVGLVDDTVAEVDEDFLVRLRSPVGATLIDEEATVTVIDDDDLPRFTIADARAGEADGTMAFTVALSHQSALETRVQYDTFDNTAAQPDDYTALSGTLVFAPGTTSQTITVTVAEDLLDEFDETFTVRLSSPSAGAILRPTEAAATGTIADNDPEPNLRVFGATAFEGDPLNFTAILDAPSGRTVTVDYTTADGTAGVGEGDYYAASGTLAFDPGETLLKIPVTTRLDAYIEAEETLGLSLSNPRWATLVPGAATATGTIRNQELPAVSITDASALEGDPIVFTVELSQPSDTEVIVEYRVNGVTANYYSDYRPTGFQVVIPAGQTQTLLAVQTIADSRIESDETFLVELTGITGSAQIGDFSALGTIIENALAPALSVDDPAGVAEGGTVTFTVTLARTDLTADSVASVAYTTHPLTADEGVDYTARSGWLDFPVGTTTQVLAVPVQTTSDEFAEANETFQLTLHSAVGASIEDPLGTGTILDDDLEPNLSFDAVEADEGTPLVFTATLDAPSGRQITADYATSGLTATDGVDYIAESGSLVFPVGVTSQQITVDALPDGLIEPDETFEVVLSDAAGAVLGADGIGTIIDATRPAIRVADASAQEGGDLVFIVTLNRQSTAAISVDYATSDGTATAGADYTGDTGTVTFAPGITQQTVSVTTLTDDEPDEPDETLTLTLDTPTGGSRILDDTATGTIYNFARPIISISDAAEVESELLYGSRLIQRSVDFTVRLSRPSTQVVTVEYETVDGTALGGLDYTAVANETVTFAVGQTSATISIDVSEDNIDELAEKFTVLLSGAVNADIDPGAGTATGTIHDKDPTPRVYAAASSYTEGHSGSVGFSIFISPPSSREVTVDWTLEGAVDGLDIALAGEDFDTGTYGSTFTEVFSPGITRIDRWFTLTDDDVFEDTERLVATLSNPINATITAGREQGIATIYDDEPFIYLFTGGTATESQDVVFTVYRSGNEVYNYGLGTALMGINYETYDIAGGATAGIDYEARTGTLTIPAGQESETIAISTLSDSNTEAPEQFGLRLTLPPNIGIRNVVDNSAIGTIVDGTQRVVSIYYAGQLSNAELKEGWPIREGGFPGRFIVELNAANSQDIDVPYTILTSTNIPGEASASDFNTSRVDLNGNVTITAGELSQNLDVYTTSGPYEPTETFQVEIMVPQGQDIVLGTSIAGTEIVDNTTKPEINISDASVIEAGVLLFTVSISHQSEFPEPTSVEYEIAGVSAVEGINYTADPGTLDFDDRSCNPCEKTIEIPTMDDQDLLGDKTLIVRLKNPVHGVINRDTATGRILNDDCVDLSDPDQAPPTLSLVSASADEGENLSFTVMVSPPFCDDVAQAVTVTTELGTAGASDVTTPEAVLGFKAGETEVVYSGVLAIEDSLDEPDETMRATVSWHSSMPAHYTGEVSAVGTINDDDDEPNLRVIDAVSSFEGGPVVFVVELEAPSGKEVTVGYYTNGLTAVGGDDYQGVLQSNPGTIEFAPGETVKQIVVQSVGDALDEGDEKFQLVLFNQTNAMLRDPIAVGTIRDDDPLPMATIADASANEDGSLQFTITLVDAGGQAVASGRDVTVVYATAHDTDGTNPATGGTVPLAPGDDYTAAAAAATIVAGSTTTTIMIPTTADSTVEPDETFLVQLLAASPDGTLHTANAAISTTSHTATGTIRNDD